MRIFAAAAVAYGVLGGIFCNFATQLKFLLHYDDALDIFAVHTIGGIVGNVGFCSVRFGLAILNTQRLIVMPGYACRS